ncbi:hypothetical protein BDQ17DRAFT_1258493, partial [Cyathus striatus]
LYRLYLVWSGDKRVVYPFRYVLLLVSVSVTIGTLRAIHLTSPDVSIFVKNLQKWIVCFFSLTLLTNFTSTLLIASRIWWTHRQTRQIQVEGRSLSPAIMMIIESGLIYSVCLVILLALYLSGNYAAYIAQDTVGFIYTRLYDV